MVVLEAMLQAGRDTVPFFLGLWRWWVVPGLVAWVVFGYFVWVYHWKRIGAQILGYVVGLFLTIAAIYWEAARIIVFGYGRTGLFTPDIFLAIILTVVQMFVGALGIIGIVIFVSLFIRQK